MKKKLESSCPSDATACSPSSTPETDAVNTNQKARSWESSYWNMREHARKLERQRDDLRYEMKELYNVASFDWDTMPEAARRKFREVVLETADRALSPENAIEHPTEGADGG